MKIFTGLLLCSLLCFSLQAQESKETKKLQFAYVLKLIPRLLDDKNWTQSDNEAVGAHFKQLKTYLSEGKLIMAGRSLNSDASQFGLVVLEVDSEAEARTIMENDAAVKAGIMTAQLVPFYTALMRKAE